MAETAYELVYRFALNPQNAFIEVPSPDGKVPQSHHHRKTKGRFINFQRNGMVLQWTSGKHWTSLGVRVTYCLATT
jgi:hypothetical protein